MFTNAESAGHGRVGACVPTVMSSPLSPGGTLGARVRTYRTRVTKDHTSVPPTVMCVPPSTRTGSKRLLACWDMCTIIFGCPECDDAKRGLSCPPGMGMRTSHVWGNSIPQTRGSEDSVRVRVFSPLSSVLKRRPLRQVGVKEDPFLGGDGCIFHS